MSIGRVPAVKYTGLSPQGMNASNEGEIRAFYDTIRAMQTSLFKPGLTTTVDVAQLSLWGKRNEKIKWDFEELWEETSKERSDRQKAEGERDQIYVDLGVLAPEEVRQRVIDDPQLPYGDLDPDDVPDLADEEEQGLEPKGGRPDPKAVGEEPGADDHALLPFDGAADETDAHGHEHAPAGSPNGGQFVSQGGGGGGGGGESELENLKIENQSEKTAAKKTPFGGLWKGAGSTDEVTMGNLAQNYDHVIGKPTNAGSSYRQMLAFMIKKAEQFKLVDMVPPLKAKLGEAFKLAGDKAAKLAGENAANPDGMKYAAMAKKAYAEAANLGANVIPGKPPEEVLSEQAKENSEFAKKLIKQAETAKPKLPAPTKEEIEKAKKSVKLQLQYVPGGQ